MSALEERGLDDLMDIILNVRWQNPMEVWRVVWDRTDEVGADELRATFEDAIERLTEEVLQGHMEVRWGMDLCMHCNDNNIERNGMAYMQPNGDGLEFNQCLNCRIGVLYDVAAARACMATYNIAIREPLLYGDTMFFWDALVPDELRAYWPTYQLVQDGRWIGTLSLDEKMQAKFLPVTAMTPDSPKFDASRWGTDLPPDLQDALNTFLNTARPQVEVALALRPV